MSSRAIARESRPDDDVGEVGMWVFLATELLFFGALLAAYLHGRFEWPTGFAAASRRTDVLLGTLNTAVLLTSSALVAAAVALASSGRRDRWAPRLLFAGAVLGMAFMAIKGIEYHKDWREGLFPGPGFALASTPGAEQFFMLYFFITALHALHLLVGVGVLISFAWGTSRASPWTGGRRLEVAALYWHFVDIVWIVLYPLLYLVNRYA